METLGPSSTRLKPVLVVAAGLAVTTLLLAALAGWMVHGTAILFTYAQDGLAWCF